MDAGAWSLRDVHPASWYHSQELSSRAVHARYCVISCHLLLIVLLFLLKQVAEVSTSKTGKHGHAKCHFVGIVFFTSKKLEVNGPGHAG
ncbi:hypothetical protein L3X38_006915 [Prunus dulcis]|uniref:Translation initiation factor 5A-like N-terminal domain-containing protein n=1 Tax=Prunus dulcis TaxID=3755 RepID=A0AAD5F5P0_PRUDU|nr:hypothetical protein L3X38_006915 [Prunus dulcis]